jgi:protein kinase C substrate 80K-H
MEEKSGGFEGCSLSLSVLHHSLCMPAVVSEEAFAAISPMIRHLSCREAVKSRKTWEARLLELEDKESGIAQRKAAAEVSKKSAESRLERLRTVVQKLEVKMEKLRQENSPDSDTPYDSAVDGSQDASSEVLLDDEEPFEDENETGVPEEDEAEEDEVEEDEVEEDGVEEDETEEERAKRIASQWIPDHEAENEQHAEEGFDGEEEYDDKELAFEDEHIETEVEHGNLGLFARVELWIREKLSYLSGNVDVASELRYSKLRLEAAQNKVDAARDDYDVKNKSFRELEHEMADLKRKIAEEYGPDDAFLPISESCVQSELVDGKYTYEVCPFDHASQKEGGRSANLGRWEGFSENGESLIFSHGDTCWDGPERSMKVTMHCGAENSFHSVAEPSRCEYTGVLTTPASCSSAIIEELETELRRRRKLLGLPVEKKVEL